MANPTKPELRYNAFGFNIGGPVEFKSCKPKTFFFYNHGMAQGDQRRQHFQPGTDRSQFGGNMTGLGHIYVPNTTDPVALAKYAAAGWLPGQEFPGDTIPASLIDPNCRSIP